MIDYSQAVIPYVSAIDNYFDCPLKNSTLPFNGCRSFKRPFQPVCTRQVAPVNFCDAVVDTYALKAVDEGQYVDDGSVVVSSDSVGFSDAVTGSSVSTSRSSRTSRSSTSRSSSDYVLPSTTWAASNTDMYTPAPTMPPTEEYAVIVLSAPEVCYDTTPNSVLVPPLGVDTTDRLQYCKDAMASYTCTKLDFNAICGDIEMEPLNVAQEFTQETMNLALRDCANMIKEHLRSYSSVDRDLGMQMASQYNVQLTQIDCTANSTNPVVVLSDISDLRSLAKLSSSTSRSSTLIIETGTGTNEVNSAAGESTMTAIGAGSAAALVVVGGLIGGFFAAYRRRSSAGPAAGQSREGLTGSNVSLFQNPTYVNENKVQESGIYEAAPISKGKRRSSIMRNKI